MQSGADRLDTRSRERVRSQRRTAILPPKNFSESLEQHPHLNPLSAPPVAIPRRMQRQENVVAVLMFCRVESRRPREDISRYFSCRATASVANSKLGRRSACPTVSE